MGAALLSKFWGILPGLRQTGSSGIRDLDIVIHIGLPKTGSSAIQLFCLNNRAALSKAGLYYPKHTVDKNGVSGGHAELAHLLRGGRAGKAGFCFRWMLFQARLRRKVLLLSSEEFGRVSSKLAPLLVGLNVRVVGFFRHPIETFFSDYNQSVKRSFEKRDPVATMYAQVKSGAINRGAQRLHRWADALGDDNCAFLPYSKDSDVPIEKVWLQLIGVEQARFSEFEFSENPVNKSYVPEALELKRLLNWLLPSEDQSLARRIDLALQNYSDEAEASVVGLGVKVDPEAVQMLGDKCSRQNKRLVKRFPSLKPVLPKGEQCVRLAQDSVEFSLKLQPAIDHVQRLYPDDVAVLKTRLRAYLDEKDGPQAGADLAYLAELLGVGCE